MAGFRRFPQTKRHLLRPAVQGAILLLFSGFSPAQAAWKPAIDHLRVHGLALSSRLDDTGAGTTQRLLSWGGGFDGALKLVGKLSLFGGLAYAPFTFQTTSESVSYTNLHAPFGIQFAPLRFLSLKVGGFGNYALGDLTITPNGGTASTVSFSSVSMRSMEAGLLAGLELRVPLKGRISLSAEGRALRGLSNLATAGALRSESLQVLAGLAWGMKP
jgi:hypothetical protein